MTKFKSAPDGERSSIDGTEIVPLGSSDEASSWWASFSTFAAYLRTLTQTLTGKTINLTDNTLTGTKAQFNTAVSDGNIAFDAFKTISVSGQSDVVADSDTDTLTLAAGSGVTITTTAGSDTVTIANTGSAFVLNVDTTPVGNITTGEDDLISYSVPANTLDTNSQYIHFTFGGTFASSINNKRVRVKFGSTTLFDTGALVITAAGDWSIEGYIVRTGSATQRCIVEFESNETALSGSADYVDATEDLTTILALKATGEATDTNDVVQKFQIVEKGGGAATGSSGSAIYDRRWVRGDAADADDDEFNDDTIGGAWSRVDNSGHTAYVSWDEGGDSISCTVGLIADAAAELHAQIKSRALSIGDYIQCHITGQGPFSNYPMAGIFISNGSTYGAGAQAVFSLFMGTATGFALNTAAWTNFSTRGSFTDTPVFQQGLHLRLKYSASNQFEFYCSPDAVQWLLVDTKSITLTPSHIGIQASGYGSSTPFIFSWDYFRVNAP